MTNKSTLISVIIPNYNHARFLDERLQSVLNQTYQNFEVIILDDKSTDNSVEVINKYKNNPHISHIVINEVNSGSPFKQWHKGFELARGEWIWIAESDDSCEPEFLKTLVGHIDDKTSFVFCRSQRIGSDGLPINDPWQDNLFDSFTIDGSQFLKLYLLQRNCVWNASSVVFRRDNALLVPLDYIGYRGAGDWVFWICLSKFGCVSFVQKPLNHFRLHGENTTQKCYQSSIAEEEMIKVSYFLLNKKIITKKQFREKRKNDIYRVGIYENSINKEKTYRIYDLWNVSLFERSVLWMKRFYIFKLSHYFNNR